MDAKDWYECGARIGELVQSAIDSNDFKQLSELITNTIEDTADSLKEGLDSAGRSVRSGMSNTYRSRGNAYQQAQKRADAFKDRADGMNFQTNAAARSLRKLRRNYKGIAPMIVGSVIGGFNALMTLFMTLYLVEEHDLFGFVLTLFFLAFAVGFGRMARNGLRYRKRVKQLAQYLRIIGDRDMITIEELAAGSGETQDRVRKDLRDMIRDDMFADAVYLDEQETTLMMSAEVYKQYSEAMKGFRQRQAEAAKQQREAETKAAAAAKAADGSAVSAAPARTTVENVRKAAEKDLASYSEETRGILKEGRDFIAHLHRCNELIPGEEITRKLDRMEMAVTRIFDQVAKHPDSAPDLHRLMDYYLPVTRKLIDAYVELQDQNISGANVNNTKNEIEKSLDTINEAFETLLDSFFEDTAWDISSDISAMKTMMARDGLTNRNAFSGVKSVSKDLASASAGTGSGQTAAAGNGAGSAQTVSMGAGAAAMAPQQEDQLGR